MAIKKKGGKKKLKDVKMSSTKASKVKGGAALIKSGTGTLSL